MNQRKTRREENPRVEDIVCVQPSSSKDSKELRKFSQFDTSFSILCNLKTEKTPELFIVCCNEFENLQNHAFPANFDGGIATLREYRRALN